MPLFTKGETVTYGGWTVRVDNIHEEGRKADLVCETIPEMPVRFMNINNTDVTR